MRILIADDDPQMLRALRITLTARGYQVVTASDGKAALDAAISSHPDIVVIDLGMPGLSGIEVIEALRGWTQIPVLVVSGMGTPGPHDMPDGARFIPKPYEPSTLVRTLRAFTNRAA